jgi:hypothetical protein
MAAVSCAPRWRVITYCSQLFHVSAPGGCAQPDIWSSPVSRVPGFSPSLNAPLFANARIADPWPAGTSFTLIPGLPQISIDTTVMGFCGGMSFLTRDIFEAGTAQLRGRVTHEIPLALAQLIQSRLVDSFLGPGTVANWLAFTRALDHDTVAWGPGAFGRTVGECMAVMADIDAGMLCPIGVVLTQSLLPEAVFDNHAELVWGYDLDGHQLTLHVYDCNAPGGDEITITLDISSPTPAKTISTNGTNSQGTVGPGTIRGFFRLPYTHKDPSGAYIDDAVAGILVPPPAQMTPRSQALVEVTALNIGSTSWTSRENYKLGSQAPQDNVIWGTGRVELSEDRVDPQGTASFVFHVTAPVAAADEQFCWQMLRENLHWFGLASPAVLVGVGSDSPLCEQLHTQYVALKKQYDDVEAQLAELDPTNPVTKGERGSLARQAQQILVQIVALEAQQTAAGCAPG